MPLPTPDPNCPRCEGAGYVSAYWMNGLDPLPCRRCMDAPIVLQAMVGQEEAVIPLFGIETVRASNGATRVLAMCVASEDF